MQKNKCWVCNNEVLSFAKSSILKKEELTSDFFAITDHTYGLTGELYRCDHCDFLQCIDFDNVLTFYENLCDPGYEASREERSLQAKKILLLIEKKISGKSLLDVGAGSGILVEQALSLGLDSFGIEPSKWLQEQATTKYQLPVSLGTLPHPSIDRTFDIITLIDVIEHVPNPKELIKVICNQMHEKSSLVIITPDVNSLIAKLLGWKWWHYRVAHIGYFTQTTLDLLMENLGLHRIYKSRPCWYFTAEYLLQRVNIYLPKFLQIPQMRIFKNITIPLNLGDSILSIYQFKNS
jgi:2-polyprenyl-3-methyl-5-hydroxy-6-metoxy-1,4-benzoquinol methylase